MVNFIKKIYPDIINNEFRSEQAISYTLPRHIIDAYSLQKYYTGRVDPVEAYDDGTYLKRFLPPNSSAIIDNLEIYKDGQLIQNIPDYALLHKMYEDVEDDYNNNSDCSKNDTVFSNYIDVDTNQKKSYDFFNTDTINSYQFCIKKWLGFLNPKNRYIDCRNAEIKIVIRLSPKTITYRGLKVNTATRDLTKDYSNWDYYLTNCFLNVKIVKNDNLKLDNEIFFDDYSHFKGNIMNNHKNTIIKGITNKNIKYIISTFTDKDRLTDTGLQLQHLNQDTAKFDLKMIWEVPTTATSVASIRDVLNKNTPVHVDLYNAYIARTLQKPNLLNNSIYFKRNATGIKTNLFRVNGTDITPPLSPLECFNNLKSTLNTQFKISPNLSSYINDFYISVVEYNSNDEYSNVEWEIIGDSLTTGGTGHIFLVHNISTKI
jgi:hypothetical protein